MRAGLVVVVWCAVVLLPGLAVAEDAQSLRRELDELRRRQEEYQKAIDALAERLRRLESQPAPSAVAPPAPPPATPAPRTAGTAAAPTLMDVARPREPFALSSQRGAGQLLFDIGVAGDFVADLTQRNVDKADAGSFPGRENRFFPREVELSLFGQVDPYARAEVRIDAGEEASGDEEVSLAEAHLTLLTLPWGTRVRLGQMRSRFAYSNEIHEHDLPWVDRPNALRNFLGEDGLIEKGLEATIVPDLPFYLEGLVGVFNGDNDTAFGYRKLSQPLVTARLRTFVELTDEHAIQLGLSGASGETPDRLRSQLAAFEVRYKLRPDGWLHPLLTVGSEGVYSSRRVEDEPGQPGTRDAFGWYVYGEVQPWRRWAGGVRYDWSQYPVEPGSEWAVQPYLTFWPSEFLRFRLAYKHTERSRREPFSNSGGSGRLVDELLFQASFILGAHPAHPF